MFNEKPEASMEIKQTNTEEEAVFENPYVDDKEEKDVGPTVATMNLGEMEPPMPEPVILYRSKEGIQRWLDEEKVGQLLAQTKNMQYDDAFKAQFADEIKAYFEKQPEGREVASVFEILEPGDSVNHQTVVSASDDRGLELDYFGRKSTLVNPMEIFSILIKDEMDEWKRLLKELDINKIFSKDDDDLVSLYRVLELTCMDINMEECEGLYVAGDDVLSHMITAVAAMSLKKPIYEDNAGKKVIAISVDYKNDVKSEGNILLYSVALTNSKELDVKDKDFVVLC